jgi:hypothetical protein
MVFSVTCVNAAYPILRPLLGHININNFTMSNHKVMRTISSHEVIDTCVILSRHEGSCMIYKNKHKKLNIKKYNKKSSNIHTILAYQNDKILILDT